MWQGYGGGAKTLAGWLAGWSGRVLHAPDRAEKKMRLHETGSEGHQSERRAAQGD